MRLPRQVLCGRRPVDPADPGPGPQLAQKPVHPPQRGRCFPEHCSAPALWLGAPWNRGNPYGLQVSSAAVLNPLQRISQTVTAAVQPAAVTIASAQGACLTLAAADEGSRESVDAKCRRLTATWVREKATSDPDVETCSFNEGLDRAGTRPG